MRNMTLKLAACLLVFLAAADPAAAEDKKNYPGLACLASGNSTTSINRSFSTGRALNPTTGDLTFICPAVKDHIDHDLDAATMYVLDQRPDRGVSCVLRSGTLAGGWFSTSATTASFYGSTPAPLTFASLPTDVWSTYWFHCTVPGPNTSGLSSGIVMYQIDEKS